MMQLSRLLHLAAFCIMAIGISACYLLSPPVNVSRFYVLTAMTGDGTGAPLPSAQTSSLVLGLGPIRFPDYLERNAMVTRIEPNRLLLSETDFWAEPLKDNFTHVLAQNLSTLLGTQQIVNFPWYSSTRTDYQIVVNVDRFECESQAKARLAARWFIENPINAMVLDRGSSDLFGPGGESDACAAGLSQTVADFSRQLAMAVNQVVESRLR
jgi:uncharacterized protein